MASKKAGRLAGLAALAGLAYMANKKGETKTPDAVKSESKSKGPDRDTDTGVDAMASDAAKKPAVDLGEIRDEAGTLSKLRRNTETGEMYDPTGSTSGKSAAAKVATRPKAPIVSAAKAPAASTAMPEGAYRGVRSETKPEGAYRGTRSDSQAAKNAEQAKLMSSYKPRKPDVKLRDTRLIYNNDPDDQALYANKTLRRFGAEERPESEEQEIFGKKRGGVVKKMASGGMTSSASKRADGIASKGKTRGRMC
jgi:hypothetical protein